MSRSGSRLGVCLLLAVGLFAPSPRAEAQARKGKSNDKKVYKVTFETMATEGTPWHKMYQRFIKKVTKASNGRLKIKAKFGSPLGENVIAKRCIDGKVDACAVTVGALSTQVKDLSVLELPYLFLDFKEVDRILAGPALIQVKKILAAHNLVFYCWAENGWRSFGTKEIPIRRPEDLQGLKMRAMQSKHHVAMYSALKAKGIPINLPDVVAALEKGEVVGFDQSPIYLTAASWQKHIKYYTLTRHMFQPALVVFNKKFVDRLPPDLMSLILKSAPGVERYGRKQIRAIYEPLIQNIQSSGVKVIRLTPAQRVPFVIATKKAHMWVYKRLSRRARRLLDIIYKAKQK
jgi:TRAP-type C4-dicarboxylate transport system substrate-binding protein